MERLKLIYKRKVIGCKAQAWGIDLMIAAIIFTVAIVAFYFYALNDPKEAQETIDLLFYDGNIIADSLLSEGYPKDWGAGNAVTIGILSNNRINETKLERFYDLAETDYAGTRSLFNTKYNYYFSLSENMTIHSTEVEGIGLSPQNEINLVKITRFIIYEDKPVTAYIYVWE